MGFDLKVDSLKDKITCICIVPVNKILITFHNRFELFYVLKDMAACDCGFDV